MSFTIKEQIERQKEILNAIKSPMVKEQFKKYIEKMEKEKELMENELDM